MQNGQAGRGPLVWLLILLEGSLGVLAWALGWLADQPPGKDLRWDVPGVIVGIVASMPLLLAFWLCLHWPAAPLANIRKVAREFIRPLFVHCTLLELAMLAVAAGIGEELLFRGFLQAVLGRKLGLETGLAVASLVFGLLHAFTPAYTVLATLMGAYLGGLWLVSGNLLAAIMAHALYDFMALVYLVRSPSGLP